MKATELRIGNKALLGDSIVTIGEICYDGIETSEHGFVSASQLSGIPLTEEWLLKFGFDEQTKEWNKARWFQIHSDVTWTFWMDTMAIYSSGDHWTAKCEYVHQLQNLYFTLTGEELIIK